MLCVCQTLIKKLLTYLLRIAPCCKSPLATADAVPRFERHCRLFNTASLCRSVVHGNMKEAQIALQCEASDIGENLRYQINSQPWSQGHTTTQDSLSFHKRWPQPLPVLVAPRARSRIFFNYGWLAIIFGWYSAQPNLRGQEKIRLNYGWKQKNAAEIYG